MTTWSVDITLEHTREQPGGVTVDTIRVQECVEGVSPANDDALWAAQEVLMTTVTRYSLDHNEVRVARISSMSMGDREEEDGH